MKYLLLLLLLLVPLVSADLGDARQYECNNIRVLANCSSINLTEVTVGSVTYTINAPMQNIGGQTFNYSFCNTSIIGTYSYSWNNPCVDCSNGDCGNKFEVTRSGRNGVNNIIFILFIIIFIYGLALVGVFARETTITILGGMALLALGVYIYREGLIIYYDWLTEYFSYLTIGIGVILTSWAVFELLEQ